MPGLADTLLGLGLFLSLFAIAALFVFIKYKFTGKFPNAPGVWPGSQDRASGEPGSGWMQDPQGHRDQPAHNHFE
ncbi:MAG: hypothetical protein MI799_24160 [Desulfobacterales bacterium]|nr:hypothetical protein [Desulfobacterales bacterium]